MSAFVGLLMLLLLSGAIFAGWRSGSVYWGGRTVRRHDSPGRYKNAMYVYSLIFAGVLLILAIQLSR